MSKLYTVTVTYDFVVVADDVTDAYSVGRQYASEAMRDIPISDCDMDVVEGASAYGWDGDCLPYGGDGNTRTSEYLVQEED